MVSIYHLPIEKISAMACRDYGCFDGLSKFDFVEGVNTIVGRNQSEKFAIISSLMDAITFDREKRNSFHWYSYYDQGESLIELVFYFSGQKHYLRRVFSNGSTTDFHLYIGEGDERRFLRDGQVQSYFEQNRINNIDKILRQELNYSTEYTDKLSWQAVFDDVRIASNKAESLINRILAKFPCHIAKLYKRDDGIIIHFKDGRMATPLDRLGYRDSLFISLLTLVTNRILSNAESNPGVFIIDDFEGDLDKPDIHFFNDTFNYLAREYNTQFFLTSRYKKNRNHVININKLRRTNKSTNRNYLRKVINNFKSNIVIKSPPYNKKFKW